MLAAAATRKILPATTTTNRKSIGTGKITRKSSGSNSNGNGNISFENKNKIFVTKTGKNIYLQIINSKIL